MATKKEGTQRRNAEFRRKFYPRERYLQTRHARELRAHVREIKSQPCADCGGTFDPVCMDFDHRPGEVKLLAVSKLANRSRDVLLAEIAKCDVVCANCHRLRTRNRGQHLGKRPRAEPVEEAETQPSLPFDTVSGHELK